MTDISPKDLLLFHLRDWWKITLFMILGGLVGGLFHLLQPPIYQSSAIFSIAVDYARTGPLEDDDADMLLGSASYPLVAPATLARISERAAQAGIFLEPEAVFARLSGERKDTIWLYHFRDEDPARARTLARLFGEAGGAALAEAHTHAEQARGWQLYLENLAACEQTGLTCSLPAASTLQQEMQAAAAALATEMSAANGMPAYVTYALLEAGTAPQLVLFPRNTLVLAGAAAGFIAGLGWLAWQSRRQSKADADAAR